MPSTDHESIVELLRHEPKLVATVLRAAFDLPLPVGEGRVVESTLGEIAPAEYRADLVLAFENVRVPWRCSSGGARPSGGLGPIT